MLPANHLQAWRNYLPRAIVAAIAFDSCCPVTPCGIFDRELVAPNSDNKCCVALPACGARDVVVSQFVLGP